MMGKRSVLVVLMLFCKVISMDKRYIIKGIYENWKLTMRILQ